MIARRVLAAMAVALRLTAGPQSFAGLDDDTREHDLVDLDIRRAREIHGRTAPELADSVDRAFNEADRLIRGEIDPDFAALAASLRTPEVRSLLRRFERPDQT